MFVLSALLSPRGVFTMFVYALPPILAFRFGLALLWVLTRPRRRRDRPEAHPVL